MGTLSRDSHAKMTSKRQTHLEEYSTDNTGDGLFRFINDTRFQGRDQPKFRNMLY